MSTLEYSELTGLNVWLLRAVVGVVCFKKVGAHSGADQPLIPNLGAPSLALEHPLFSLALVTSELPSLNVFGEFLATILQLDRIKKN